MSDDDRPRPCYFLLGLTSLASSVLLHLLGTVMLNHVAASTARFPKPACPMSELIGRGMDPRDYGGKQEAKGIEKAYHI